MAAQEVVVPFMGAMYEEARAHANKEGKRPTGWTPDLFVEFLHIMYRDFEKVQPLGAFAQIGPTPYTIALEQEFAKKDFAPRRDNPFSLRPVPMTMYVFYPHGALEQHPSLDNARRKDRWNQKHRGLSSAPQVIVYTSYIPEALLPQKKQALQDTGFVQIYPVKALVAH